MIKVVLPFIGKDITQSKVEEVITKLCIGFIDNIVIYENYDCKKRFRSAEITLHTVFSHDKAKQIFRQLGNGGEVVIRMHKYKTSRWILRNYDVGNIFGLRPKKNQNRIYIDI